MIKNAKFPGYYFDKEHEHWGYFHISISVPVMKYQISTTETGIGDKNLPVELLPIFFRKPITRNTLYLLCESPMYLR